MIKKYSITFLLVMTMVCGISTQRLTANEINFSKIAKIVWNGAEIYAGLTIGSTTYMRRSDCHKIIATTSLLFHGLYGLNKELKIFKRLKDFLK